MIIRYYIYLFLISSIVLSQPFYSPIDVATAGAALGGKLGTHAIQSNPALLGLKYGESMATVAVDTVTITYRIELATSSEKEDIMALKDKLGETGPIHNYLVVEKDSLYVLETQEFKDILSASVFAGKLPDEHTENKIIPDSTRETINIPKKKYFVQLIASAEKDSLKTFKKRNSNILKGLKGEVVFIDSLYKYRVGGFYQKLEAQALKDSILSVGISQDAFIVKEPERNLENGLPRFTMNIPLGFTFYLGNNVINMNWINKYAGADMVENPDLKTSLLSSIPSDGISGLTGLSASILSLTYGSYGFSPLDLDVYYKSIIPKPFFQAIFEGMFFNQPVDLSDFDTRILVANSTVFSYGKRFKLPQSPFKTYMGFGLRFLTGGFGEVQSFSGTLTTTTDSIKVESDMQFGYGYAAAGIGLDIGLYAQINKQLSAQVSFIGVGGSLRSGEIELTRIIQEIQLSNQDIENIQNYDDAQTDSLKESFTIMDTTYLDQEKRVSVPGRINMGLSYRLHQFFSIHASMQQMIQTEFIGPIKPRFSIGAEFFPDKFFPIRIGVASGGMNGFNIGTGLGLKMKMFHINLGLSQSGGLGNSASGINVAADMRIFF